MDTIFAHFISRGDDSENQRRLAYASWFVYNIPDTEFSGDERIFFEYMRFCDRLSVPLTFKYFQVWMDTELHDVLHKTNARVNGTESLNFKEPASFETAFRVTKDVLSDDFNVLEASESDLDDFKVEIASYFTQRRKIRLTQALASTYDLLNQADSVTEASAYAVDNINIIDEIYDINKLDDLDTQVKDTLDKTTARKISDSGLPAIDNDSKGLFETQLFDIESQSGGGKTRFVLGTYVYRALTIYKHNVAFFALEQRVDEIDAMLVAHHTYRMFNIQVDSKMIYTGNVPAEAQSKVESARIDLFQSGKYGKFYREECTMFVETFISKIRTLDKLQGPFDLICIDYMGMMESQSGEFKRQMLEFEIIRDSLKLFKRYLRASRKAGISVSQFNDKGTVAGEQDKNITENMAQGGLAVFRNTDYNIAISYTTAMKSQQKRRFSQPKVRDSAGFDTFIARTRLGFCYFEQIVQEKV